MVDRRKNVVTKFILEGIIELTIIEGTRIQTYEDKIDRYRSMCVTLSMYYAFLSSILWSFCLYMLGAYLSGFETIKTAFFVSFFIFVTLMLRLRPYREHNSGLILNYEFERRCPPVHPKPMFYNILCDFYPHKMKALITYHMDTTYTTYKVLNSSEKGYTRKDGIHLLF